MDLFEEITYKLALIANKEYAIKANAYLLNQFKLLGVYTPQRRLLIKPFLSTNLDKKGLINLVNKLWCHEYRDFKYIACSFMKKNLHLLSIEDLPWIQSLALIDSWWDTIDSLAPIVGKIVKSSKNNPMDDWIKNDNIWIRRIAIIHQLGFREYTDVSRLSEYSLAQSEEKEFFIRKAIGWAFRDYARYDPKFVFSFMHEHRSRFSNLTFKEATKHL